MSRYNNGIIFTNDNCIACNKCVSGCALMGANVSIVKNGKAHMEIDSRKCNDCGRCIASCVHNARDYRDDTDAFFADLEKGEKISVIIAPTFFGIYGDQAEGIIGTLKEAGVDKIYDGAFGREISVYLTARYIKENSHLPVKERAFISNTCPSLVTVIQKYHPFLLKKLIPVQPAPVCSAIYAHKYLGDKNKIAYLSSCVAVKDEIDSENTGGNINYSITFSRVLKKLSSYNFEDYKDKGQMDLMANGFGSLVARGGDFADLITFCFPHTENIIPLKGFSEYNMQSLYLSLNESYGDLLPLLAEVTACQNGCIAGPGSDPAHFDIKQSFNSIAKIRKQVYENFKDIENPEKFWKQICTLFKYIRPEDFKRSYTDYSCQTFTVPQSTVDEIFNDMLKDTPQKRNINCRSCGYNSCTEMMRAIAFGYSRKESCIHYMNDLLIQRINTDQLTGLKTRESFIHDTTVFLEKNPDKTYILAVGDVNKLKIINTLYGFPVGNDALCQIAATLKQIAGENGIVARLGGGTFSLVMENTVDNLQRLQSCKVFNTGSLDITFPITMHFGICIAGASMTVSTAISQASLCMDYNISPVQNTFSAYSEQYSEKTHVEAEITAKMRPALEGGEFQLWFQPQYSAGNGKLVGAEALCRWVKPDGSIISPGLFIPVAEKNGFIRSLDKSIWENAFATIRSWIDLGIEPVPVSINISRISLESDKLYYIIKRLKEKYKIPEKYIHFEITESAAMTGQKYLNDRIQKIRSLGFRIAMDDFGSGYSSLNSLKTMPIDILKLDMGFLRGDENIDKGGTIITYVARLAQGLEYMTVAEGVETKKQADFLRSIGVNVFQGYLYAKPMPEEDFLSILKLPDKRCIINKPEITGQIDVKKFFDPESPESRIFEDFTGPAAIYEYDDKTGDIFIIRANKKYLSIFEMENLTIVEVKQHIRNVVNKTTLEDMMNKIKETISEGHEVVSCIEAKTYLKEEPIWVKSRFWEISRNENIHSLYFLSEDVTEEKLGNKEAVSPREPEVQKLKKKRWFR